MDRLISSDASNTAGRRTRVVLKPTILGNQFEVAAVRPPRALVHDLATIFPDIKEPQKLIVVPTVQRARLDLAAIGQEVEDEKNRLLASFTAWSRVVVGRIRQAGHWVDYADPMTAMPALGKSGPGGYSEVEGFQVLLHYHVQNVGCCKVILHPRWQSRIYPATLFTTAPSDLLLNSLNGSIFSLGQPVKIMSTLSFTNRSMILTTGVLRDVDLLKPNADENKDINQQAETRLAMQMNSKRLHLRTMPSIATVDLDWTMANGDQAKAFVSMDLLVGEQVEANHNS